MIYVQLIYIISSIRKIHDRKSMHSRSAITRITLDMRPYCLGSLRELSSSILLDWFVQIKQTQRPIKTSVFLFAKQDNDDEPRNDPLTAGWCAGLVTDTRTDGLVNLEHDGGVGNQLERINHFPCKYFHWWSLSAVPSDISVGKTAVVGKYFN